MDYVADLSFPVPLFLPFHEPHVQKVLAMVYPCGDCLGVSTIGLLECPLEPIGVGGYRRTPTLVDWNLDDILWTVQQAYLTASPIHLGRSITPHERSEVNFV